MLVYNFLISTSSFIHFRHVHVPKDVVKKMPKERTMSDKEWRDLGIQQSHGWVHYMIHKPGMVMVALL